VGDMSGANPRGCVAASGFPHSLIAAWEQRRWPPDTGRQRVQTMIRSWSAEKERRQAEILGLTGVETEKQANCPSALAAIGHRSRMEST
jgi:hypothetical protein